LGASDLTLLEHTSAFTTFPNDGVHITPRTISRVTNYDGRVIDDFPAEVTDVLPAGVARLMVSMLREPFNSGTAIRAKAFAQKYPVAGKTGTTNDFTDAWFLGFSPSLTCGVYVGFDDHRTLGPKEEGAHVALPIWQQFMEGALKDKPREDFPYSPLLTNPEQVKEILASAGADRLFAQGTGPSGRVESGSPLPASGQPAVNPVSISKASPQGTSGANSALLPSVAVRPEPSAAHPHPPVGPLAPGAASPAKGNAAGTGSDPLSPVR
jgi:penicillin-binding protein 1A